LLPPASISTGNSIRSTVGCCCHLLGCWRRRSGTVPRSSSIVEDKICQWLLLLLLLFCLLLLHCWKPMLEDKLSDLLCQAVQPARLSQHF
jgi:hypothetical protein